MAINVIEKDILNVLNEAKGSMSVREITLMIRYNKDTVYKHCDRLKELGLIGIEYEHDADANRDIMKYYLLSFGTVKLPNSIKLTGNSKDFEAFDRVLDRLDNDRVKIGLKPVFDMYR
jgi:hypothetical protein